MKSFKELNSWVSDHKILSGFAGVILIVLVTFFSSSSKNTDESGNINFNDETEINDSNISGRDLNIKSQIKTEIKDSLPNKKADKVPAKKEIQYNSIKGLKIKSEDLNSNTNMDSNKTIITRSNIAGRDINIYTKDQSELIQLLKMRAEKINSNLKDYYYYSDVKKKLADFNELHKKHIKALEDNNFVLAHELLSRIHMISFSLDMEEEEAQQLSLYGELRTQYLRSFPEKAVVGGIANIYFGKKIKKYDSTKYVGPSVYGNFISKEWPKTYQKIEKDSLKEFYRLNFITDEKVLEQAASR